MLLENNNKLICFCVHLHYAALSKLPVTCGCICLHGLIHVHHKLLLKHQAKLATLSERERPTPQHCELCALLFAIITIIISVWVLQYPTVIYKQGLSDWTSSLSLSASYKGSSNFLVWRVQWLGHWVCMWLPWVQSHSNFWSGFVSGHPRFQLYRTKSL